MGQGVAGTGTMLLRLMRVAGMQWALTDFVKGSLWVRE